MESLNSYFEAIGFTELNPIVQIISIILLSYVTEDATTAISTIMQQAGSISLSVYLIGLGVGLFTGDLLLYFFGAFLFKRYQKHKHNPNKKPLFGINPEQYISKDSKTLKKRFLFILLSRFIPGTRFPAYIGAGITRFPLKYFILSKLIAIPTWIAIFYFFGQVFAEAFKANILYAVILLGLAYLIITKANDFYKNSFGLAPKERFTMLYYSLTKYRYFEYWPGFIFYIPSVTYCAIQVIRHKFKFWVPSSVNPAIKYGGVIMEPKSECCDLIKDIDVSLKNVLLKRGVNMQDAIASIKAMGVTYPIILKPEFGHRGAGVRVINNTEEAEEYLSSANYDVLAQEFCDYKNETGIFYIKNKYRHAKGEELSQIFSITHKVFPVIKADGVKTIAQLILADKRARYSASKYMARFADRLNQVPKLDEELALVKSGSHSQGCKFEDGMQFTYSDELKLKFDKIAEGMGQFYFGRFDVRYKDLESLKQGKNFKIVEVNGATAEATHIFDDKLSLFNAFKVLYIQTAHLYEIANNNIENGTKSLSFPSFLKKWWQFLRVYSKYKPGS